MSEAVPARRLVAHILHALSNIGWHLAFATDMSKKGWDKDTLFFKPGPPQQRYFFPVSFNESDKIRLIDSPTQQVTTAFQAAVSVSERIRPKCRIDGVELAAWYPGCQGERAQMFADEAEREAVVHVGRGGGESRKTAGVQHPERHGGEWLRASRQYRHEHWRRQQRQLWRM